MAIGGTANAQDRIVDFDVPGQPASTSIPVFAREANIQVLVSAGEVDGKRTNPIRGSLPIHDALNQLLAGTGLVIKSDDGRTIVLSADRTNSASIRTNAQLAETQAQQMPSEPVAVAQAAEPIPTAPQTLAPPEQVLVTGSLLGAANFAAPTPVTQVTGVQIQTRALTGVGTVIEELPFAQVGSGLTRNTSGNQRAGQSYPNLRGLGPVNTLVLIDGMRPTPVNQTNNFDTDMIPQSLLDRFEVVTTGASATYGSDAVAGAVNFILKDHLEGLVTDARFGISQYGDTDQSFVSAAWGTTLLNGRGHFVIGGEFANQFNAVDMYSRPWGREEPGLVSLSVATAKAMGLPANLLVNNAEIDDATNGGLIQACKKGTATVACPAALNNITFSANGTPSPFALGSIVGGTYMVGSTSNYGVNSTARLISPPYERWAGLARFEYDIAPDVTAFAMVNYGELTSNNSSQGTQANINVLSGNPDIPASIQSAMTANNISSITLNKLNWDGTNLGKPFENRNDQILSFFGIKGSFFSDYNWDLEGNAGRTNVWQESINTPYPANFDLAANGCNPLTNNNQIAYTNAGSTNTATTAATVNALATPGCVPYNPFGTPSAASVNYINTGNLAGGPTGTEVNIRQYMAQGDITGPVFSLPAGAVDLAIGGNYRYNSYDSTPTLASFDGVGGSNAPVAFFESQSVWEAYSEIGVPILRDLPFAQAIDLNGAGRYTDYSITGPVWTWKYGGTWDVTDWLRLRATRSQDVRAPNFAELSTVPTGGGAVVQNPIDGVTSSTLTYGSFTSGNPNVHPEISQNVTAGFVVQPSGTEGMTGTLGTLVSGFRASVDYYRIRIAGQITVVSAQNVLNLCLLEKVPLYCNQVVFSPGFNENSFTPGSTAFGIAGFNLKDVNANSTYQDGIDIDISERVPLDGSGIPGAVQFSTLASYIDQQSVYTSALNSSGQNIVTRTNYADSYSAPRWGVNTNLTYLLDRFTANLQMRYYSPQRYILFAGQGLNGPSGAFNIGPDDPAYAAALAAGSSLTINRAVWPASIQWNLAFTYDLIQEPSGQDLQVYFNVDNLLNKSPPVIWWWTSNYDVVGRYFKIGIRYTLP